jgi:hypothetical protein
MKRCALCHGRLGLGVRFRNIWNGRWWVHVRFCSARCEGIYRVSRSEAAKRRWHIFLAPSNSRSCLIGAWCRSDALVARHATGRLFLVLGPGESLSVCGPPNRNGPLAAASYQAFLDEMQIEPCKRFSVRPARFRLS